MFLQIEFPDEKWSEMVVALTTNVYQDMKPNPLFGTSEDQPEMVPNPISREEAAKAEVANLLVAKYKARVMQTEHAKHQAQIDLAVQQECESLKNAISVSVA